MPEHLRTGHRRRRRHGHAQATAAATAAAAAATDASEEHAAVPQQRDTDAAGAEPVSTALSLETDTQAQRYLAMTKAALEPRTMSAAVSTTAHVHEGDKLAGRWLIVDQIGQGGFGQVYRARDLKLDKEVAVKVSSVHRRRRAATQLATKAAAAAEHSATAADKDKAKGPQQRWIVPDKLMTEIHVLLLLKDCKHVPRVYGCGESPGRYHFAVMELLSRNLSDLRRSSPKRRFSRSTAFAVAAQALTAIQAIHGVGFLHRDIKPSNMVLGTGASTCRTLYVIDYGLVRRYREADKCIRRARASAHIRGTPRYASLHVHERAEQSRRDDCASWYYSLLDMAQGDLPWKQYKDWTRIKQAKIDVDMDKLCEYLPYQIRSLYDTISSLEYADEPPYARMQRALAEATSAVGGTSSDPFDWEVEWDTVNKEKRRKMRPHGTRTRRPAEAQTQREPPPPQPADERTQSRSGDKEAPATAAAAKGKPKQRRTQ